MSILDSTVMIQGGVQYLAEDAIVPAAQQCAMPGLFVPAEEALKSRLEQPSRLAEGGLGKSRAGEHSGRAREGNGRPWPRVGPRASNWLAMPPTLRMLDGIALPSPKVTSALMRGRVGQQRPVQYEASHRRKVRRASRKRETCRVGVHHRRGTLSCYPTREQGRPRVPIAVQAGPSLLSRIVATPAPHGS